MSERDYEEDLQNHFDKSFGGTEEEPQEEHTEESSLEEDNSPSEEETEESLEPKIPQYSDREQALKREFNRKKREAYRYQKSLEQAQSEIIRLANLAEENKKIGMYYYGNHIESDIRNVQKELENAISDNDAKLQSELQSKLSELASQKVVVDNFKLQNEQQEQQAYLNAQNFQEQQQYEYQKKMQEVNQGFNEWINYNEWANPENASFDPELCNYVRLAGTKLDKELIENGRTDLIGTPEYFQEMDHRVELISNARDQGYFKQYNRQNLNMRKAPNMVSPVRYGQSSRDQNTAKIRLSSDEMDMARNLGIRPQDYLKAKLQDIKERPERYGKGR